MDTQKLVMEMRRLAILGGAKIMEVYARDDFDVKSKSDDSPVTEADEAADAVISAGLRAAYPDVALVTEEQADSHTVRAEQFFIVDPLDGTKEFINRRGDFTVNIHGQYRACRQGTAAVWRGLCPGAQPHVLDRCIRQNRRGNRRGNRGV